MLEKSSMKEIYFGLGSNLGNREQTIQNALQKMAEKIGKQQSCSAFFYSEPWGYESENGYCNVVACFTTDLALIDVLHITQEIEKQLGRLTKSVNGVYHDRTIDIDLILCFENGESVSVQTDELTIPHRFMKEREFVMTPLKEICKYPIP